MRERELENYMLPGLILPLRVNYFIACMRRAYTGNTQLPTSFYGAISLYILIWYVSILIVLYASLHMYTLLHIYYNVHI